jgi:site-specific recombinase XerD
VVGMVVNRQVAPARRDLDESAPGRCLPATGHLSIEAVQTGHIRDIMLTIETRGASDVAKRVHQSIGQIFRFAIARDLATRNPATEFKQPIDVNGLESISFMIEGRIDIVIEFDRLREGQPV